MLLGVAAMAEACPPPDTGRGWGPTEISGRQTTKYTLGGAGVKRSETESSAIAATPQYSNTQKRVTINPVTLLVYYSNAVSSFIRLRGLIRR